jgi:hypothetical protein
MDFWKNLTVGTRRLVIVCVFGLALTLIICAAVTGNFDMLLGLFDKAAKK